MFEMLPITGVGVGKAGAGVGVGDRVGVGIGFVAGFPLATGDGDASSSDGNVTQLDAAIVNSPVISRRMVHFVLIANHFLKVGLGFSAKFELPVFDRIDPNRNGRWHCRLWI